MRSLLFLLLLPLLAHAQPAVSDKLVDAKLQFPLVDGSSATGILYDAADEKLVEIAASLLAGDVERVSGRRPELLTAPEQAGERVILIGSLGHSALIDRLIAAGKLNVDPIRGG